jgi:hypothetical protein
LCVTAPLSSIGPMSIPMCSVLIWGLWQLTAADMQAQRGDGGLAWYSQHQQGSITTAAMHWYQHHLHRASVVESCWLVQQQQRVHKDSGTSTAAPPYWAISHSTSSTAHQSSSSSAPSTSFMCASGRGLLIGTAVAVCVHQDSGISTAALP